MVAARFGLNRVCDAFCVAFKCPMFWTFQPYLFTFNNIVFVFSKIRKEFVEEEAELSGLQTALS